MIDMITWYRVSGADGMREYRRGLQKHMVACCVADCDIVDNETGEVCFEYGDILVADDLERILALGEVWVGDGDGLHTGEWTRDELGSIEVGAALCNVVLLIALIVFLVIVAVGVRLPVDLMWLPKQMGF